MSQIRLSIAAVFAALVLAAAGAALAFAAAGSQSSIHKIQSKLVGKVGPGFTITLTKGGKTVKTLKDGTYKITVRDRSSSHNFHLFGSGVNKTTGVSFTGTAHWKVKFKKGKFTYRCDVHFTSGMIGHFKVGSKTTLAAKTTTTTTTTTTTGTTTTSPYGY
jgi:plastocyanin